jgi:hypothetical protein
VKCHHWTLFPAITFTSLQVFPSISASSSYHSPPAGSWSPSSTLSLGVPIRNHFLCGRGFFLSLCPIHYHFFSLTWIATDFSCAHLHVSSFEVTSYQKIFKIFQRYLFIIGNTVECPCIIPDFHTSLLSHFTSSFSNSLAINSLLNFFYLRFSTANLQNHCTKLNHRWSLGMCI